MKLPYQEGTFFAVPLSCGGYGCGVVARMPKGGKVLFGYFFGPRHVGIPTIDDVANLTCKDAIKNYRFGDLSLIKGEWPIMGRPIKWDHADWPMPPFLREELGSNRNWEVNYSDVNPNEILLERRIVGILDKNIERDSLRGAGVIEIILSRMLCVDVIQ